MSSYINNIKSFLSEIKTVNERYSESKIEFEVDTKVISASSCNKNNSLKLDSNFARLMVVFPLFFSCLDSIIDIQNPQLINTSFNKKYNNIKVQTESDKVIKEIYRIMIIIRNISSHNINSCIFNSRIDTEYQHNGTNYKLDMNQMGLRLIYGFILTVVNESNYPCFRLNSYKDGIYVGFYKKIMDEINDIQDNRSPSTINVDFHINYSRDTLEDAKFSENEDSIKLKYELDRHSNINFYINYNNSNYVIPQETLDENYKILLSSLEKWKMDI